MKRKKIYFFMLAAILLSSSVSAQKVKVEASDPTDLIEALNASKAPSLAPLSAPDIIKTTPEGVDGGAQARSGFYWFYNSGPKSGTYVGSIGKYITSNDGNTIYILNPFHGLATNSWIKLDKTSEGKYTAHLPQPVVNSKGVNYYAARLAANVQEDAGTGINTLKYTADTKNTDIDYEFHGDTLVMVGTDEHADGAPLAPKYVLGYTNEAGSDWYGIADARVRYTPIKDKPAQLPDGVEPQKFVVSQTLINQATGAGTKATFVVDVAIDGNDIYVNNPITKDASSWIKGSIEDGKVVFEEQYVGADTKDDAHLWFIPGKYSVVTDSTYFYTYGYLLYKRAYSPVDNLTFDYDADNKKITNTSENSSIILSRSLDEIYTFGTVDDPAFEPYVEHAVTPADPIITTLYPYSKSWRYGEVIFNLPNADVDGNFIDPEKLYYNLYVDDAETPFVFSKDEYKRQSRDEMVDVPYAYTDNMDIFSSGNQKMVIFYFQDFDSLGVQSIYRVDGQDYRSNIVWKVNPSIPLSISGPAAEHVTSTVYYDITGRRIDEPKQGGLYIKEETTDKGTKKTVKILRK